ncbi:class I SAM-dependent methyltransferase [Paenibacillus glycanilyticus]|uniref:Ubiquinone biosynthesis methyltransferase UbiE n=1 Tax=Paenibacillus glycanilyticus TaxID=126569 RepID=A0ABQ6GHQ3_9BACL|nr:class I SAM-dependent methyltransferase [Paenibacillus glycanilyticus]GLX70456.1 ubiquinone biosynthesis methyltransferase UbiE [Paenibacillus glycanilyticus]
MQEKVAKAFDQLAVAYASSVDQSSGHNAYYERPAMMKLLPEDLTDMTVLDAGCAAGWYTAQLLERGAAVTAIDLSQAMVAACRRRVGNQANVMVHDLSQPLPFEDESFDLIVSSLTLHYIEDWDSVLTEFRRVLKPNGQLLFSVHHPFMVYQQFDQQDYFARELLTDIWNKKETGPVEVTFYHKSMMDIVNSTTKHFTLDQMIEPQPSEDFIDQPGALDWYKRWYDRLMRDPWFLIVKALKT